MLNSSEVNDGSIYIAQDNKSVDSIDIVFAWLINNRSVSTAICQESIKSFVNGSAHFLFSNIFSEVSKYKNIFLKK